MYKEIPLKSQDTNSTNAEVLMNIDTNLIIDRFHRLPFIPLNLENLNNEDLCTLYHGGKKEALDFILNNNKKLIYSRVLKYGNLYNNNLNFDDLVQHGYIGLIKAAERYDHTRNTKFSTYSTWWIDKEILKGIFDSGFLIRIPSHKFEEIQKVWHVIKDMGNINDGDIRKIASKSGIVKNKVKEAIYIINNQLNIFSLNNIITKDGDTEFINTIQDNSDISMDNIIEKKELSIELSKALNILSERERKILKLRYGLEDCEPMTLEEIGIIFNLSKERIRQIEIKVLKKLRESNYINTLNQFR